MASDYLSELASFASETPQSAIPLDVRERASVVVTDCVGCMIAGARVPEVAALTAYLTQPSGGQLATAVGTARQLMPKDAALVGGTAGTWHDLDEGNLHTRTHAAIQIAPAALAEAEVNGVSGPGLIDAFVVGYEVAARLWRATQARLAVHPHGTYGPLAATVALSRP